MDNRVSSPIVDPHLNNAFEYGLDYDPKVRQNGALVTYDRESVRKYRAKSIESLLDDTSLLMNMIVHHKTRQVPRLEVLEDYYLNNNSMILHGSRRLDEGKSDHRIRHSFASVISDFLTAHTISNPVKIVDAAEGSTFTDLLDVFNFVNDIDAHNIEISKDQNNMGRAYELLQRTEDDKDRIYLLDPTTVFMIHDLTVRARVIGAVRYFPIEDMAIDGREPEYIVELYTWNKIYRSVPTRLSDNARLALDGDPEPHLFGGVPIVEYRSDRFRMAVYERQLPLIDAYDAAQSDTANYMTDFNDAMLAIYGRIKNAEDPEYVKKMKDANTLFLIPPEDRLGEEKGTVKAEYLVKHYDVQGVEAYKSRLKEDIFNFSNTPDLSDDSFAGTQTGEAMKYKLFGLQQKRSDKEKFLAKGFRVRYKLLENLKRAVSEYSGEEPDLSFKFSPNLPTAYIDELLKYSQAGGQVSHKTALSILSFVDDPEAELEQIEEELKQRAEAVKPADGHNWEAEYDESVRRTTELRAREGMAES